MHRGEKNGTETSAIFTPPTSKNGIVGTRKLSVCFRAKKPTRNNHVKNVRLINEAIIRKSRRVTSRCPHVTLQHGDTNKGCSASVGADKCLPQTRVNIFGRMPLIIILGVDYAPRAIKTKQTEAPGVAEGTSHVGLDR